MQLLLQQESDSARYYEMLHLQNENQRILIHDMKKHLQSIALLNEDNENEKIRAYIDQLMQSSDLLEFSKICDHKILNNICAAIKKCVMICILHFTQISAVIPLLSSLIQMLLLYSVTCWIMRWRLQIISRIPILKSLLLKENIPHLSLLQ